MTKSMTKANPFAALPAALALAFMSAAFADTAEAAALAEPTISMMNKCAIDGTIEQVGRSHIKCCMPKYCIWCNTTTNKCWVKGRRAKAAPFAISPKSNMKLAR